MITEISYDHGRYTITANDVIIGHGETYHECAEIEERYLEARHSPTNYHAMRERRGTLNHIDDDAYSTTVEREQPCTMPDNMCSVDDPCPMHAADAQAWRQANTPIGTCSICCAAAWNLHTQGLLCPDHFGHWSEWQHDNTPLLADCAAIIRRCLGRTTGAARIVDELRRVEARLAEQGW